MTTKFLHFLVRMVKRFGTMNQDDFMFLYQLGPLVVDYNAEEYTTILMLGHRKLWDSGYELEQKARDLALHQMFNDLLHHIEYSGAKYMVSHMDYLAPDAQLLVRMLAAMGED